MPANLEGTKAMHDLQLEAWLRLSQSLLGKAVAHANTRAPGPSGPPVPQAGGRRILAAARRNAKTKNQLLKRARLGHTTPQRDSPNAQHQHSPFARSAAAFKACRPSAA
jgi:hypothetical protein